MAGYELIGDEERLAVDKLFSDSNGVMFAHGFEGLRNGVYRVRSFESDFANRFSVAHAQAVSSGSAALLVALRALDLKNGDEVFENQGIKIVVDQKSLVYVKGTEMDFVKQGVNEGFEFKNPNAKGECGCGESFTI